MKRDKFRLIIFLTGLVFFLILSCKHSSDKVSQTATMLRCVVDSINADSVRFLTCREYDSISMKTLSKGHFMQDLKTGNIYRYGWHSFFENGKLIRRTKYMVIKDSCFEEAVNQNIVFNEQGDTIKEKSTYLEIAPSGYDTFRLGQIIPLRIKLNYEKKLDSIVGNFKLYIINPYNNELIDSVYSHNPGFIYNYHADKTGLTNLEAHVIFYVKTKSKDSLSLYDLYAGWNFYIEK